MNNHPCTRSGRSFIVAGIVLPHVCLEGDVVFLPTSNNDLIYVARVMVRHEYGSGRSRLRLPSLHFWQAFAGFMTAYGCFVAL